MESLFGLDLTHRPIPILLGLSCVKKQVLKPAQCHQHSWQDFLLGRTLECLIF